MRIGYNLILSVTLLLTHGVSMGRDFIFLAPLWLAGAVAANILYLAGPLAESYFTWLGLHSQFLTWKIFILRLVLSITCVYFFPMIGFLRFNQPSGHI